MRTIIAFVIFPSGERHEFEFDVPDYATKEEIERNMMNVIKNWLICGWGEKKEEDGK